MQLFYFYTNIRQSVNILRNILLAGYLLLNSFLAESQEYYLDIRKSGDSEYVNDITGALEARYRDTSTVKLRLKQSIAEMRSRGFLAASYDSLHVGEDTVTAWLHTGRQYRWGRFSLSAPDSSVLQGMSFSRDIRSHEVIDLHEVNALQERIITYLENQGYPFASVKMKNLEHTGSDTLNASLNINPGKRYMIDSILIKGDDPVSEDYLYPYLGLFPGMKYDESKLQQIRGKVENLEFLRQIRDFELEFSEDRRVNVYLYLERAKSNQVDGVVGFLPQGDGKIRFTGQFDLRLSNLFRRGEYIALDWNSLEEKSQELTLEMDYPYLFLQSVGLHAGLEIFKKDTSFLSRSFQAGLSFYIDSRTRLEVYGDFGSSSLISESSEVKGIFEPYNMRLYGLKYAFKNLDYRLNPSKGLDLDMFVSLGKRRRGEKENKRTSAEAGLDIAYYQPLLRSWVIKTSANGRYKHVWTEGEETFKKNELYRFGGFHSLRGFGDNAFLASAYSVVSLELRWLLSRNSNLYAFWDGGWYQGSNSSGIEEGFPLGFGVGTHVDTGGGIMYISYALGKQVGNPIELGSSKIHLGFVSKF